MTSYLTIALAFVALLAPTNALSALGSGAPCPDCLNGGLCLPNNADSRGAQTLLARTAVRCFCLSPWVGAACEKLAFDDEEEGGDNEASPRQAQLSLGTMRDDVREMTLDSGFVGDVKATNEAHSKTEVLLVSFTLDARGDPDLQDGEVMRFAVYSALCPSSPCPSGLVLEDIKVLSLSEDREHHTHVRLAISPPSTLKALRAEVAAQLTGTHSNLGADAFQGLILHSGFALADAKVLAQPPAEGAAVQNAAVDRSGFKSLRQPNRFVEQSRMKKRDQTEATRERMIPHRHDRNTSLHEKEFTSCATYCISVLSLVFLILSVNHICVERFCRWFYPSELESSQQPWDTDEFQHETAPNDRDFQLIRALLEVSKLPMAVSGMVAILMYLVQARARELTRGFGDPPVWAETCMKVYTVSDLTLLVIICVQAFVTQMTGAERITNRKSGLVNLFLSPNWSFVIAMTIVSTAATASAIGMVYCVFTMTPGDCVVHGDLAKGILQDQSPPLLSLEHKMVLVFVMQFLVLHKLEAPVIGHHVIHLMMHGGESEDRIHVAEMKRDLEFDLSRIRFLTKTANLAPLLSIIALAIREVPALVPVDQQFRAFWMHSVAVVMLSYTLFIAICIYLPKGQRIEVDLAEGVVTLSSNTDYIVHTGAGFGDAIFRNMRRILLFLANTIALMLACSVFFLRADVGPSPAVPWPISWTLFIMIQTICVSMGLLWHEVVVAPYADKGDNENTILLDSAIREVEGFMALAPLLCLIFLCAHSRAREVTQTGEIPQWVLTAVNSVAQTLLLQLIMTLLEVTVAGFLFEDRNSWAELHDPKRSFSQELGREGSKEGFKEASYQSQDFDTLESTEDEGLFDGLPPPPVAQGQRGAAIQGAQQRLDEQWPPLGAPGVPMERIPEEPGAGAPVRARSRFLTKVTGVLGADMVVQFLATRFFNLFFSFVQLWLLLQLYVSAQLILLGIWTMDADTPHKTYSSGDWRSSIFPLLPVSAPTTTALETMVWFVALFFAVKGVSSLMRVLRHLYDAVLSSVYNALYTSELVVELVPLVTLLCHMVQSRANDFHGFNASPPYFVQAHMVVIVVAMTVEVMANLATPAFISELTNVGEKARLVPYISRMFLGIESVASLAMHWGVGVLLVSLVTMRAEDVVLYSGKHGTNGIPWHGKGESPKLPFIAWNMWAVCIMVFFVSGIHKACHHGVSHSKYADGIANGVEPGDAWFNKNKHLRIMRWHHASILARHFALGAIILASLYLPLQHIASPVHTHTDENKSKDVPEDTINFMKMLFFVASIILCVKTFLIFCKGAMEPPTPLEVFREAAPQDANDALTQPILERPLSIDFAPSPREPAAGPMATLISTFLRLVQAVHACEFVAVATLAFMLFPALHEHTNMFSTGGWLNGSIYLFALYLLTHFFWGFTVLEMFGEWGNSIRQKMDILFEIVSACPLLMLLFMTCRQRAFEVAGKHGVVPEWIHHSLLGCFLIVLLEFVITILTPSMRQKIQQKQALRQDGGQLEAAQLEQNDEQQEQERAWQRSLRVSYVLVRSMLKLALYSFVGVIIFGLFWMTEEQCLPKEVS